MNNKMTEKITPRDVDYAQWYTDVVKAARLCDYTDVKGCMIYLPNGQAICCLLYTSPSPRDVE